MDLIHRLVNRASMTVEQQQKTVTTTCIVEIVLAIVAIIIVAADPSGDASAVAQAVLAALVMLTVGLVGIYGAHKKERGSLLFFFIIQMWVISALTSYLQATTREAGATDLMCAQLKFTRQSASADGCASSRTAVAILKMIVAALTFITAVASSFISFRLSEKIQELEHEAIASKTA
uniref:MARVEL domain-containing protein n=1 Tax=Bicosoecida sp. CB-2014 TaxID=1486930 RepID=A0A7S1G3V7_9STRA